MKGPNPDILSDDAAGRAAEALGEIVRAPADAIAKAGEESVKALSDLLPGALALLADVAGVVA